MDAEVLYTGTVGEVESAGEGGGDYGLMGGG